MTREVRLVFLSILTFTIYAAFMWIEKGFFLFPFPLNETLFFLISAQFVLWNFRQHKVTSLLILGTAFFQLLGSEFFWLFLIDGRSWEYLQKGWLEIFTLTHEIFLLLWMSYSLYHSAFIKNKHIALISLPILLVIGILYGSAMLICCSLIAMTSYCIIHKDSVKFYPLWILLTFLYSVKTLLLYFFT